MAITTYVNFNLRHTKDLIVGMLWNPNVLVWMMKMSLIIDKLCSSTMFMMLLLTSSSIGQTKKKQQYTVILFVLLRFIYNVNSRYLSFFFFFGFFAYEK